MTNKQNTAIALILQEKGTPESLKMAGMLHNENTSLHALQLRSLNLVAKDAIANCLSQVGSANTLTSISLSYNKVADTGAAALAARLPKSITELGLVGCGITDTGGLVIIQWMATTPALQVICIEQNEFSETLKTEFRTFSNNMPRILVVV